MEVIRVMLSNAIELDVSDILLFCVWGVYDEQICSLPKI